MATPPLPSDSTINGSSTLLSTNNASRFYRHATPTGFYVGFKRVSTDMPPLRGFQNLCPPRFKGTTLPPLLKSDKSCFRGSEILPILKSCKS